MSKTVGSRPVPKVPGPKSKFNTNSMGGYSGTSGSKSPTGSRPRPKVTGGASHSTPPMVASKRAVKHTSMPAPNKKRLTGAPKQNGGS